MNEDSSSYGFYSMGIVLVDKERKSDNIKVLPIEQISTGEGKSTDTDVSGSNKMKFKQTDESSKLADQKMNYTVNTPDAKGIDRQNKISGELGLVAKWTAFGQSNRMTSPDVIKGETVMIFKVADTGEYFWTSMMREPAIRRLETVCHMFGNIPSGIKPWDKDTSYWIETSTHDKYIHIHTAKNDGEPFMYDIRLDTGKGTFELTDNSGNFIHLDSPSSKITVTTNEDVEVNTSRVVVNAKESYTINTEKYTLNTGTSTTNASDNINILSATNVFVTAPDVWLMEEVHFDELVEFRNIRVLQHSDLQGPVDQGSTVHTVGKTTVQSDIQTNSDLKVDGKATIDDTLEVGSDTDLKAKLTVTDNTDLKAKLDVGADTNLKAKLDVAAATDLKATLKVGANTNITGDLDVSGLIYTGGVEVSTFQGP